jgi:hypothetical protein
MRPRLTLILSATALGVALLGSTPLGGAAVQLVRSVPPFAKQAGYAKTAGFATQAGNSKAVNGIKAAKTPKPGMLVPLGLNGKLPASVGAVGRRGPAGSPGAQGPAGQSATKLWAVVHTDGTNASLIRGSGAIAATQSSAGFINVTFNQNVDSCAYLVTTGLDNFNLPDRGGATADRDPAAPSKVYVQTFDLTATAKALDFFLAVFC